MSNTFFMSNTVFIVWRESIEAMLVIGILYTWLKNQACDNPVEARTGMRFLWAGVVAGIVLASALAFIMLSIQSELAGEALEDFQIAIMLIAAVLIVQMVLWMRRHGRTLKSDLESGLQRAHEQANWWGMSALAAIAVGREGAETVIFLYGAGLANNHGLMPFIVSAASGFMLAFLTFWLLSRSTRFFSWRLFFRFSEILLLLLAAALVIDGVDRMIGLGWVPAIIDPVWNSRFLLDDNNRFGGIVASFTGYRSQPALTILLTYITYWIVVGILLQRSSQSAAVKKRG